VINRIEAEVKNLNVYPPFIPPKGGIALSGGEGWEGSFPAKLML